jgi:hypothetical protein
MASNQQNAQDWEEQSELDAPHSHGESHASIETCANATNATRAAKS